MKKADIRRSYHQGHHGLPMVNVTTLYLDCRMASGVLAMVRKHHHGDFGTEPEVTEFCNWLVTVDDDAANAAFEVACEWGWDALQNDAADAFGSGVTVYSAGRSGKWCVVHGLPDVDDWDAVQLGKWVTFEKYAAQNVANVPFNMASYLYLNVYLPPREAAEDARRNDEEATHYMAV
jgi:hypothetical protein